MRFKTPRVRTVFLAWMAVNVLFLVLPRVRYRAIVVHHTASQSGDFRDVRRHHLSRGWLEIAYHFVLSNGSTDVGLGHLEPTWRYRLGLWSAGTKSRRANLTALHVSIVGNYEETELPKALEGPVGHAIRALQEKHGIPDDRILLHRDCGRTACPGKNVTQARILAWTRKASDCPPEVRAQHLRAIGRGFPGAWLLTNVLLAGLVLVVPSRAWSGTPTSPGGEVDSAHNGRQPLRRPDKGLQRGTAPCGPELRAGCRPAPAGDHEQGR